MFKRKDSLFGCKPDPPRFFLTNLACQFTVSLVTLSFCVLTLNIMNLPFEHEETAKRHDRTEVVIVFPD